MSTSHVARLPVAPAFSIAPAGAAAVRLLRFVGLGLWRFFEAIGRARAERELGRLADVIESTYPEVAADLRRGARYRGA